MLVALEEGVKGGMWYSVHDKAISVRALAAAFQKVKANGGSAGVDGWTVRRFDQDRERQIQRLHEELTAGVYRPRPVKRVYIPKPGSKEKRPLGIPAVRDRVVQTAVRFMLEPIFEKEFSDRSYGFRPGRSCRQALRRVWLALNGGNGHVVDADFKSFFDTIPHEVIMRGLGSRIADGRMLDLLKIFLKQGILDGMDSWTPEEGTPQGSALSPLLANIALHGLDLKADEEGLELVRYADDFVVLCRTKEEGDRALETVKAWAASVGLTLHPDKTRIVDYGSGEGFDFLGYHLRKGSAYPGKKSEKKMRAKVRSLTGRTRSGSISDIAAELNPVIRGWFNYFRDSRKSALRAMDGYIRRRLRSIEARRLGLWCHVTLAAHIRWPIDHFTELGLFSAEQAARK
jgi:RNA-directed DNA polymerase